jgi:hypothetical protein
MITAQIESCDNDITITITIDITSATYGVDREEI